MASKVEILGQVMFSLKDEQNNAMNNINAALNNRDTQKDVIQHLRWAIKDLASIHAQMQETEAFILQLSENSNKEAKPGSINIGSGGPFNDKSNSTDSEK